MPPPYPIRIRVMCELVLAEEPMAILRISLTLALHSVSRAQSAKLYRFGSGEGWVRQMAQ